MRPMYAHKLHDPSRIGYKMTDEFKYDIDDTQDPAFIGIFCAICDNEIGYDPCPECEKE